MSSLSQISTNASSLEASEFELPQGAVAVFSGIVLTLQLLIALPGLLLVLYLVGSKPKLRCLSVNCMIFNLCLGELLLQIVFCLGNLYYFFVERNAFMCRIIGFVEACIIIVAGVFYSQLAINRYFAFFHEDILQRFFTTRNTVTSLIVIWIVDFCVLAPLFPHMGYESCHFCGLKATDSQFALVYSAIGLSFVATCSFVIMIYCNLAVARRLSEHKRKMDTHNFHSQSLRIKTFENIVHLLYYHMFSSLGFVAPGIAARFVPGVERFPWVGRVVGLLITTEPCTTPYVILYLVGPLREAAEELLTRRGIFWKSNRVEDGGMSVELSSSPHGRAKQSHSTSNNTLASETASRGT